MDDKHPSTASLTDRLAKYLRDRPLVWLDGRELSAVGGFYAFRTRISEVRRRFDMTIENRQMRRLKADGTVFVSSEYRYVPAPASEGDGPSSAPLLFPLHRADL